VQWHARVRVWDHFATVFVFVESQKNIAVNLDGILPF